MLTSGAGGFVRADWRFIHEHNSGLCMLVTDHGVHGIEFTHKPWMRSDEGAHYADSIRIDCSALIDNPSGDQADSDFR
jgi:hypothetical protein